MVLTHEIKMQMIQAEYLIRQDRDAIAEVETQYTKDQYRKSTKETVQWLTNHNQMMADERKSSQKENELLEEHHSRLDNCFTL